MKTKSKRPSAPARRSRGQQRARSRLLHPRAGRRCTPRSRAPPMPRRRRRPFYSMGFARSAGALDIICAAREASGSGVWRRLTRGRAQACVAWRRRAGAGREYRGAPGSARCLRSVPRQERLVSLFTFRAPHRVGGLGRVIYCVQSYTSSTGAPTPFASRARLKAFSGAKCDIGGRYPGTLWEVVCDTDRVFI